jgi:methyltransferase (TIGR00027 family)
MKLGLGVPDWLRFVPVDFEAGGSWRDGLEAAGFDDKKPALVVSTGVSMYLTKEANAVALRRIAALAPGSTLAMTFLLPLELADPEMRPALEIAEKGARASGTPFLSYYSPVQILAVAREAGFKQVQHVSATTLTQRYFAGRTDGLRPPSNAEELLVAAI